MQITSSPFFLPLLCSADEEDTKDGIQMGRTKVFLRRVAFERLEYLRNTILDDSAIVVQAYARMLIARNRFLWRRDSALVLQRLARRLYATRITIIARRYRCATLIQKNWRGYYAERDFIASLFIAQRLQNAYRGMVAREICAFMMLDKKTKTIQSTWRRYRARRRLKNIVYSVVKVQVLYRGYKARKVLKELRREARDVEVIAKQRDQFRQEALKLRHDLQSSRDDSVCSTESDPEEVRRLRTEIVALKMQLSRIGGSPVEARGVGMNGFENRRPTQMSPLPTFPSASEAKFLPPRSPAAPTAAPAARSPSFWSSPFDFNRSSPKQVPPKSLLDDMNADGFSPPPPPQATSPSSNQGGLYAELGDRDVVGTPFREQVSAFHRGISRGDLDRVTKILNDSEFGHLLVNECNTTGTPALHIAVSSENRELVKKLLENGAAGNCQDPEGNTPLHICTDHEIVRVLLESGHANPSIPNNNGLSPLHIAVGRLDVASVQHMLRRNADVNVADNTGWLTPLHLVARKANPDDVCGGEMERSRARIANLLCRATSPDVADLNFQDRNGNTPLHHVVVLEVAEACDLLRIFLESGSKPNIANGRGQTPLHLLCHNDGLRELGVMQEMLYDMLHHGANPNITSQTGCTALHLALYHRDVDSAIQVMNRGAELHLLWNKVRLLVLSLVVVLVARLLDSWSSLVSVYLLVLLSAKTLESFLG
jgi:ankyrin repeat protein